MLIETIEREVFQELRTGFMKEAYKNAATYLDRNPFRSYMLDSQEGATGWLRGLMQAAFPDKE